MAPRLGIAGIFKNEAPYILEWIAHHRALGVGRFFIADNASDDGTTALLAALARAGIVDHLPFPTPPDRAPQHAAYEALLRRHRGDADWIAFLDADEFLLPAAPHRSLPAVLAAIAPGPEVGAIAVNWAIYGSSGHWLADDRPVAARFTRRAAQDNPINRHYKSILRPEAVLPPVGNTHRFLLQEGLRIVRADGGILVDAPDAPRGLSAEVIWHPLRINHYVIKSWEEFETRKRPRGRATRPGLYRDTAFFEEHDCNEIADPMPDWLLAATAAEVGRLKARLPEEAALCAGR